MNKKNITPNLSQPVDRVASGKLPAALAGASVTPSISVHHSSSIGVHIIFSSYDGDNE